jgi:hypothetical protein
MRFCRPACWAWARTDLEASAVFLRPEGASQARYVDSICRSSSLLPTCRACRRLLSLGHEVRYWSQGPVLKDELRACREHELANHDWRISGDFAQRGWCWAGGIRLTQSRGHQLAFGAQCLSKVAWKWLRLLQAVSYMPASVFYFHGIERKIRLFGLHPFYSPLCTVIWGNARLRKHQLHRRRPNVRNDTSQIQ